MRTFIMLAFMLSATVANATPTAVYVTVDNRASVEANREFLRQQEEKNAKIRNSKKAKAAASLAEAQAELKAAGANHRLVDEQATERPVLRSLKVAPAPAPKPDSPKLNVPDFSGF
jgi:hypothetical protein